MEKLILVNKRDEPIGSQEKLMAHKLGQLHRAFSIFIFNPREHLMLQKRANNKYHCGGLWSNTCCGHPRPGEKLEQAVHRRLEEEMGFDCDLEKVFDLTYKIKFDNELWENEYVHVFFGRYDGIPRINIEEASNWRWVALDELRKEMILVPEKFTYWFKKELNHPDFESSRRLILHC